MEQASVVSSQSKKAHDPLDLRAFLTRIQQENMTHVIMSKITKTLEIGAQV